MKARQEHIKVIISGGGTGGHVFPAIAIADAVKKELPNADILFVGAQDKLEMEKVPKAGYSIKGLWISGFHRKLTMRNLMFPFKLVHSLLKSRSILNSFKPDVAVGVGGFASGPLLEMATRMGIPTLIQEQNSFPGITNRLLAKKVDRICVAYDKMDRFFPKDKIVYTGNPIRTAILSMESDRMTGIQHFGLDEKKKTIFVFGGSLGAKSINEAMAANAALINQHPEIQVLWQVGKLYFEDFKESETAKLPNVKMQPFIDRMDLAYAMADVVVCRSGAMTIAELSIAAKPVVFIPSPNVAEDHQTKNAAALEDKHAAVLVPDKEGKVRIIQQALELLDNPDSARKMAENLGQLAIRDAAQRIKDEVLKLIAIQPSTAAL